MRLSELSEQFGHWVHAGKEKKKHGRLSFLLHPKDRERFLRWGHKKKQKKK